jgi:hypothetical protein
LKELSDFVHIDMETQRDRPDSVRGIICLPKAFVPLSQLAHGQFL